MDDPASSMSGSDNESLNEVRRIPLFRSITRPSGLTTANLAVKSVSVDVDSAQSRTFTGPVTSVSRSSGGLLYTRTSDRCSTGDWSYGPCGPDCAPQQE